MEECGDAMTNRHSLWWVPPVVVLGSLLALVLIVWGSWVATPPGECVQTERIKTLVCVDDSNTTYCTKYEERYANSCLVWKPKE